MLCAVLADARGRLHFEDCAYPQVDGWSKCCKPRWQVDAGAIARSCDDPRQIPVQVDAARTAAIRMRGRPATGHGIMMPTC
jgi:tRNA nucleotidyltransferase (CCA-adding enzyme)